MLQILRFKFLKPQTRNLKPANHNSNVVVGNCWFFY